MTRGEIEVSLHLVMQKALRRSSGCIYTFTSIEIT